MENKKAQHEPNSSAGLGGARFGLRGEDLARTDQPKRRANCSKKKAAMSPRQSMRSVLAAFNAGGKIVAEHMGALGSVDAYWREGERRWPYLICAGSDVIGFAFLRAASDCSADYSFAEFYIRPDARGSGRGIEAAKAVLSAHSGVWRLAIFLLNAPAQAFWPRAIAAAGSKTPECFEEYGETVYRFVVARASQPADL